MQSSRIIFLVIFGIFALVASIWLGQGVATDRYQTLLILGAVGGLLISALSGQKIWLLFILLMSMDVPIIRGFGTSELGQFLFIGFSTVLFLLRKIRLNTKFSELEFWRFAMLLMILQVYMRNPAGLNMFGASQVGGKPYLIAALAFGTGYILSKYRVDPDQLKWAMRLQIIGSLVAFPVNAWRYGLGAAPSVSSVQVVGTGLEGPKASRDGTMVKIANLMAQVISSRISPLRACIHPFWAVMILSALAAAAVSGFRNTIANVGLLLLSGIAYRGGLPSVVLSVILAALGITGLALINSAFPLPMNAQRSLSVLPGTWDEKATRDAEDSTEWRVVMWKEALLTDKWIENKFLGDGLGFSKADLAKMEALNESGNQHSSLSGLSIHQESAMLNGDYHSGPVQTIRTIGYFGLLVMLVTMVRMAVISHREIMRCKNTQWFTIIIFFSLPIIIYPIFFTFVIGDFGRAVTFIFINSAIIDLFRNNLPLPPYTPASRSIPRPLGWKHRPVQPAI